MTLNDFLKNLAAAKADPETLSLPEDDSEEGLEALRFNPARFSVALVHMMCHTDAGKFGYIQQLAAAPNIEASVARDALNMLRPESALAREAWKGVVEALPSVWLETNHGSSRRVWPPERAHTDEKWAQRMEETARASHESQSPWG